MIDEIKIKGIYRHYKGVLYLVEDIATHSETGKEMVIYRGLYDGSPLWVRPKSLFLNKLDTKKAQEFGQEYRFELQDIKSVRED